MKAWRCCRQAHQNSKREIVFQQNRRHTTWPFLGLCKLSAGNSVYVKLCFMHLDSLSYPWVSQLFCSLLWPITGGVSGNWSYSPLDCRATESKVKLARTTGCSYIRVSHVGFFYTSHYMFNMWSSMNCLRNSKKVTKTYLWINFQFLERCKHEEEIGVAVNECKKHHSVGRILQRKKHLRT